MPTPLLQGQRARAVLCRRRVLDFNHCLGAGGVAANDGVFSLGLGRNCVCLMCMTALCVFDEGNLCGDPALLRQTHAGLAWREGVSSGWIEGCEIGAKLTEALLACKDTLTYLRLNMSECCACDAVVHGRCKLLMAALAWRRLSRRHCASPHNKVTLGSESEKYSKHTFFRCEICDEIRGRC